jgi:1,4-alpha-glucan branching enzyme
MNPIMYYMSDPWLKPYTGVIDERISKCHSKEKHLAGSETLCGFAMGHHYYGLHRCNDAWIFREWAPNATSIYITGTFTGWKEQSEYKLKKLNTDGDWEITMPADTLKHGDLYKLSVHWDGGMGERIPSYATHVPRSLVPRYGILIPLMNGRGIYSNRLILFLLSMKLISGWQLLKRKQEHSGNLPKMFCL